MLFFRSHLFSENVQEKWFCYWRFIAKSCVITVKHTKQNWYHEHVFKDCVDFTRIKMSADRKEKSNICFTALLGSESTVITLLADYYCNLHLCVNQLWKVYSRNLPPPLPPVRYQMVCVLEKMLVFVNMPIILCTFLKSSWTLWLTFCCIIIIYVYKYRQGLKYNFQGGGTVQLSGPPVRSQPLVHFLGPCFNSGLSNYQWSTECIIKHDFHIVFFAIL